MVSIEITKVYQKIQIIEVQSLGTSALGKIKFIEEVDQMTDEEMTDEIFDEMKNYQYFPSLLSGKYELNTQ